MDVEFIEWLTRNAVPFVLVFTKTDKGPTAARQGNIDAFMARIGGWFEKPPAFFTCSSTTRQGREALLGVIEETLAALEFEAPAAAEAATEGSAPPPARPELEEEVGRVPDDVARPALEARPRGQTGNGRSRGGKRPNPGRPW